MRGSQYGGPSVRVPAWGRSQATRAVGVLVLGGSQYQGCQETRVLGVPVVGGVSWCRGDGVAILSRRWCVTPMVTPG